MKTLNADCDQRVGDGKGQGSRHAHASVSPVFIPV